MKYTCPVCGLHDLDRDPKSDVCFDICLSCGFQFNITDDDLGYTYDEWREMWIAKGMPWSSESNVPPRNWNPKEQLKNISIYLDD